MSVQKILYINADNTIQYGPAKSDGLPINNAIATYTLKDSEGNIVAGLEDILMPEDGNGVGMYEGVMDKDKTSLLEEYSINGKQYYLEITFHSPSGIDDFRKICCIAKYRGVE